MLWSGAAKRHAECASLRLGSKHPNPSSLPLWSGGEETCRVRSSQRTCLGILYFDTTKHLSPSCGLTDSLLLADAVVVYGYGGARAAGASLRVCVLHIKTKLEEVVCETALQGILLIMVIPGTSYVTLFINKLLRHCTNKYGVLRFFVGSYPMVVEYGNIYRI